jgi:hypothetical protein
MRVAGVRTIGEANAYLAEEYLPWWNQTLTVEAADAADAHRPLGKAHNLAAILSHVEQRQVTNDYTVRYDGKFYQIDRRDIRAGMRKAMVITKADPPTKTKTPRTGISWPGLTGGLVPSASEPAPSQRSSDLPQGARLPQNIESTLTPSLQPPFQNRTFLLCWE